MHISKTNWEFLAKDKKEKRAVFALAVKNGIQIGAVTSKGVKRYRDNNELLICFLSGYGLMTLPTQAPHLAITKNDLIDMIKNSNL